MIKTCKCQGCDRKVIARGMCGKHYQAFRKLNDLSIGRSIRERFERKYIPVTESGAGYGQIHLSIRDMVL